MLSFVVDIFLLCLELDDDLGGLFYQLFSTGCCDDFVTPCFGLL